MCLLNPSYWTLAYLPTFSFMYPLKHLKKLSSFNRMSETLMLEGDLRIFGPMFGALTFILPRNIMSYVLGILSLMLLLIGFGNPNALQKLSSSAGFSSQIG